MTLDVTLRSFFSVHSRFKLSVDVAMNFNDEDFQNSFESTEWCLLPNLFFKCISTRRHKDTATEYWFSAFSVFCSNFLDNYWLHKIKNEHIYAKKKNKLDCHMHLKFFGSCKWRSQFSIIYSYLANTAVIWSVLVPNTYITYVGSPVTNYGLFKRNPCVNHWYLTDPLNLQSQCKSVSKV